MQIKIKKLSPKAALPEYAHGPMEDAGLDVRCIEDAVLSPGYEVQMRPRSGLALKNAITLANSPATIDPGYRGELKVILLNLGKLPYEVHAGDRVAQMVVSKYETVTWDEADLGESDRGTGGFGSSGR
jgi:dUTP pyrophosphatase